MLNYFHATQLWSDRHNAQCCSKELHWMLHHSEMKLYLKVIHLDCHF